MSIYIPFTYIIGWSQHKKFYYGAKYAQGCQPKDLWTTYFTSSKLVEDYRKHFGEPDIIKIHKTFSDKDSCVLFESSYLEKIDAKNQSIFLNQSNGGGGDFYKKKVTEKEKEKTKKTHLEKYGYESSNSSPEIKEKKRLSLLEKYGVEYNFQIDDFSEKSKQTCLEKYGYESVNSVPEIKEKKKQTCLEKYGVDNATKIEKVCCYCGELKNIMHESKCKKNPDRKVPNKTGKDNPSTKWYNVTSPIGEEYIIISKANLMEFAKQKNLKHYSFAGNKIEGWIVTQISKPKEI